MNKKIFILLFFMSVLISVSAVSAVDLDDNNGTVALSNDADSLAIANDVNAIDDLKNDSDGDIKFVAVGKDNENNLLSVNNNENENILKDDEADFEELKKEILVISPEVVLKHKNYKIDEGETIVLKDYILFFNGNGATINMNGKGFALFSAFDNHLITIGNLTIKNMDSEDAPGVILFVNSNGGVENCTFVNNIGNKSGAILVAWSEHCVITGCTFVNNVGNESGAIYFQDDCKDCKVEYCAFVDNSGGSGKRAIGGNIGNVSLNDNWWGSNNPDWQDLIEDHEPTAYAVLNVTTDTPSIARGSKAKLTYAFYRNGTADMLPIPARPIKLSATGGKLDDDSGNLVNGEFTTEFSAEEVGNYEITAKVDNQEVKINVTVGHPTKINITNETIDLKANSEVVTGATLDPADAGNLTYTSSNSSVAVVENDMIKGLRQGVANITVSFAGNENYAAAENKTIAVTVHLNDACIEAKDMELNAGENATIEYTTTPEGLKTTFVPDESGVYSVDENGVVNALKGGNATIVVKVGGDGVYAENSTTVTVTVNKVPSEINIANETVNLKANGEVPVGATLSPADAGNLTYTSGNSSVAVVENGMIKGLRRGVAYITVSFAGDDKYIAAENKTISVSVGLADAGVTVNNDTLDLKVGDTFVINATTVPEGLNVTYVGDDSGVYSVDENGVVTALRNGTGFIIVSVGDDEVYAKNTTVVTVSVGLKDASVTVNNDTLNLKIDDTFVINATTAPEGLNVTYVSDDSGVYSVDENGVVTALTNGTGFIIVSVGDDEVYAKNTTVVTVSVSLKDAGVVADPDSLDLLVGETGKFNVVTNPEDLNIEVSSSNESVATVKLINRVPTVTAVGEGSAVITLTINEKDYVKNSTTVNVKVVKIPTEILIENDTLDMIIGDIVDPVVSLMPSDAGNMSFISSDLKVASVDNKGIVTAVDEGNATIIIRFNGNDKYLPSNATITVSVKNALIITAPDVVKYYGGPERFVVNVTDSKGTPLSNKSVIIVINKVTYTRTTDKNGTASIGLNLHSGTYNATVTVDNKTVNSVVNVLTTVNSTDVVKMYKNDTQYYATFVDSEGKYLADGTIVTFNINGVMYERKVSGDKGQAKLNINLPAGKYVITAMNPKTGENESNNVTVLSNIVENYDLTKYYKNASQYSLRLLDDKGNPVGAGVSVKFNINGVFYTRTSDANGYVKMNINLPPGTYTVTAEYNGLKASNKIKVLSVLETMDLSMKYGDGSKFEAKILDGQGRPYASQTVKFNINGVFYTKTTESDGIARLNINLLAGEYIITSSYNGLNAANKVTISG